MSDDKPAMTGDRTMKLLNCPFCGGFASTTEGGKRWWVGCVGTKCWRLIGETKGGSWGRDGRPRVDKHPTEPKLLFESATPQGER